MSNWWHVWFSSKWLCWKKDLLPRTIRANLEPCCSRLLPSASHDSTCNKLATVGLNAARCQKKSPTQIKSPNDSGPLPAQPVLLNGNRLMTGSVQMVAKWLHNNNSKQSKYLPPLFEAVEIFVGSEKVKRRVSQQCFSLRNWPQWHIGHYLGDVNSISLSNDYELPHCYHYPFTDINRPPNIVRYRMFLYFLSPLHELICLFFILV